jgi:hypothetical protein
MVCACCRVVVIVSLLATATAAVRAYPHQLAYFNELHGGLRSGHERLLHSNVDWGQDWLLCRDALFGPTRSVPHNYPFVYSVESDATLLAGCFRDLIDLRSAFSNEPPGTPFGLCVGRTLASRIWHGYPTHLRLGAADVEECMRRADGWSAVTPTIVLFQCRTPD